MACLLPHLPHLLALPSLRAIQWVYGAGKPHNLDPCWDDLYTRILDAGKNIMICSAPGGVPALKAFFNRFPAKRFYVPYSVRNRQEADQVLLELNHT